MPHITLLLVLSSLQLVTGCSLSATPSEPLDSGAPPPDSGTIEGDAGQAAGDAGPISEDAGPLPDDAGGRGGDASTARDSGVPIAPGATITERCHEEAFSRHAPSIPDPGSDCGDTPAGGCPATPPEGAAPALLVATCAYVHGATGCEPVFDTTCPWTPETAPAENNYFLAHPGQPDSLDCWGVVSLAPYLGADGTPHIDWRAYGYDSECHRTTPLEGTISLESCCEHVLDIDYPGAGFYFRVRAQLDWEVLAP